MTYASPFRIVPLPHTLSDSAVVILAEFNAAIVRLLSEVAATVKFPDTPRVHGRENIKIAEHTKFIE